MRVTTRALPLAVVVLAAVVPALSAQSVQEVVDGMYAAFERQARGVNDYTLVQDAMGVESTAYFVKEMVDGRSFFRPQEVSGRGFGMTFSDDDTGLSEVYEMGPQLVEHGRYAGRETVDGTSVHVIVVDDVTQLDMASPGDTGDMDFTPKSGRFMVEADRMVPRGFELDGEAQTPEGPREVSMRVDLLDYRSVEGLLVPYRTVATIEGLAAMIDPEAREQLAEMEAQLEAMPESQRQMMEQMLGDQLSRLRDMIESGGPMVIEVVVTDVRVNAGPPRQ
jgi:hypothetical protein